MSSLVTKLENLFLFCKDFLKKTSMLRRLKAQTFPDEAPPLGKIHPFRKIAVFLDQYSDFDALQDLESLKKCQYSLFYEWKYHF